MESPLVPTLSRISVAIRYIKNLYIYTYNISNLMVNMNKYFYYQNIQLCMHIIVI